jgi:hypothetical protein
MTIAENFRDIEARIQGRARLIAVSKNQPDEKLDAALHYGHRLFGENKVQEAYLHWDARRAAFTDLELHLIGPLQTNKAKDAVRLFDCIQTLDRESLVDALAKEETKQGKRLTYLIQVNTGDEPQKAGVSFEQLSALYDYARGKGLNVTGLMCIPPVDADARAHFNRLRNAAQELGLRTLSMGMSGDFEQAIEEGATHVRVGTALFGER